jgi:predicted O-methyltransferase YrrM
MKSWADIPGWVCPQLLALYDEVAETVTAGRVAEVGCAYGKSLAYLLRHLRVSVDVHAIDAWEEFMGGDNLPPETFERMRAYGTPRRACEQEVAACFPPDGPQLERVKFTSERSVKAAEAFEKRSLDFVFIDADHSFEAVRDDIAAWMPKVKKGGTLAGHDLNMHYPGVETAVRKAFGAHWEGRRNVDNWGGVWVHRV